MSRPDTNSTAPAIVRARSAGEYDARQRRRYVGHEMSADLRAAYDAGWTKVRPVPASR